jgi:hypothetical protein
MKIFCHKCEKTTNHNLLAEQKVEPGEHDYYAWGENHYFARCAGCDAFTYAVESWSENDWNPNSGEMDSSWKTYPPGQSERQPINDERELPAKVRLIYKEVIGAMNAQLPVLSGVGLRALIESICRDQGIVSGNLEKLIDGLATKGVLSKTQADILHTHRFLGNVAAHEVTPANPLELVAALEIAENVLRTIYVLPTLSKKVTTGRKP